MTSCNGYGECLIQCQCECECYEELCKYHDECECECEWYDECQCYDIILLYKKICVCGHRSHGGYCPSTCCEPVECRNYKYCNEKNPQMILYCHNGMCMNCAIQMGRHKTSDIVDYCPVCLENKNMIILNCNLQICNECWYKITEIGFGDENRESGPKCPLCRSLNDWSS